MNIFQKIKNALEYMPLVTGTAVVVGSALKMGGGGLDLCGPAEKPEYISNIACTGTGEVIPVEKITEDTVLCGTLAADSDDIAVGAEMLIHTDGVSVGAEDGGCLQVISFDAATAGSRVMFRVVDEDII